MQDVRARGDLLHRVSYEASGRVLDSMITGGIKTGFGDEWIKFGATSEHTVDGSFSERTMALSVPYPGIEPRYKGNVTETQDDLNAWIERVHRAGIQVNCHANGDVAIDMFLTAVERAQKLVSARRRAAEDHALHAHQRRPRAAHQGARRRAGDVHHLRVLQLRQVRVLRRRADEALHGVSLAARRGRRRCGRIGFQSRTVRAADGHPGHGDAQGLGRQDVGRESAHQRRRSDPGQHDQRRVRVARRSDQGLDHGGQARRTSSCWPTIRTRSSPEKIKDIQIVRTVVGGSDGVSGVDRSTGRPVDRNGERRGDFMRRIHLIVAFVGLVAGAASARAQDVERAAVIATVQKVFDAMRTRDTALLGVAFDTTARLVGVRTRDNTISLTTPAAFGAALTRAPAGDVWNERIFDPEVRIDGDLAQVWAYYTFHRNKEFTHCGVDAFMLRKLGAQWKITQLSDSRRTTGCTHTEPPG